MNERSAIYPGTFDPITVGHQDIITRASQLCDRLYVCIAVGHHKKTRFDLETRSEMVTAVIETLDVACPVEVVPFSGLLIQTCQKYHAHTIIRGLRNNADYEYERQLALMNRHLDPTIETIFLNTSEHLSYISSTMIREIAQLGGELDGLVHPIVKQKLIAGH